MKTKESIDRHAKLVLASARGQDGKHSYNIARLYFDAECYSDARAHVNCYLQSYGNSDWRAHKLLGDIEYAEGAFQEALHTYKDVLRLQPECKEALLKVGLLSAKLRPVEESAKWVREIEKRYPCETKLTEIRDIIAARRSGDRISNLRDNSAKLVNDVDVQCEYLNELINSRHFRQAFDFVVERVGMFRNSLQWHKLCSVTCENFMATQPAPDKERVGNFLILITYFRQFLLTAATSPVNSMKTLLQKLDRAIYRFISGYGIERLNDSSELSCCAKEMAACMLASVVILVNKLLLQRSLTLANTDILLIVCCRAGMALKPHDRNVAWAKNSFSYAAHLGNPANVFESAVPSTVWNLLAAERMSFFVHLFKSIQNVVELEPAVFSNSSLQSVKDQLLNIVYPPGTSTDSSFLAKYLYLFQGQMYPPLENSEEFLVDPVCESSFRDFMLQSPQNIDLLCWILLSKSGFPVSKETTSLRWMLTDKLPVNADLSSNRVSNADLQAFVLATSYWIGENLACYNKTQPFLPLMPLVCTASVREQAQVWHSLIGLRQDDTTRAGKPSGASLPAFPLFQALQIVRAQNNAMPTALVVSLAQSFSKLAQNATDGTWKETYAARSAHYWQKALPSLQNMARGMSLMSEMEAEHNSRLFPSSILPKISADEARSLHDKGTYEVAVWLKNQGNLDDSLSFLGKKAGSAAGITSLSPQCALLRTEILYEKMSDEPSNKSTQKDLLNSSLKELNSLIKRRDVTPQIKKQAQQQVACAEGKLEDLDRAEELENSLSSRNAGVTDGTSRVSLRDLAISDKLDNVANEMFEVNKNLCTIAEELREMQSSWTDSISQVTSLVGKLVELEIQKKVAHPPNMPPMGMPPGPAMGLPPHLFPQGQIPQMIGQYPQQIPMGNPPVSNHAMFPAPPNPQLAFRAVPPPMSAPNSMPMPSPHGATPQVRFTPPSSHPVYHNISPGGAAAPKIAAPDSSAQSPSLNALLKAPSNEIEKKLSQPFQPPKSMFQPTSQAPAFSLSLKDSSKSNAVPVSQSIAPNSLFTSTPKQEGAKMQLNTASSGQEEPGAKTSINFGPNAALQSDTNPTAPKSLFSTMFQQGKGVQPEMKPITLQTKDDPKTTLPEPQPTTGIAFGNTQLKPGTSSAPFSFKMPPSNPFSPSKSVTQNFGAAAGSVAPEQAPVIPSAGAKISFGAPTAFTGFKGFSAPANTSTTSATTTTSSLAATTSSIFSVPTTSSPKTTNMFSGLYDSVLRTSSSSIASTSKLSGAPSSSEHAKTSSDAKLASSGDSMASVEPHSFKFMMSSDKDVNKAQTSPSVSPQKLARHPEKPSNTVVTDEVKSPGGAHKEGDDSYHDPQFEPIVHLDKVTDIKTGEESEEVVFLERAKLYRLLDSQWRERGVGEMKILKSTVNNLIKYRIVMRRDQVRKLCANHVITDQLELKDHPNNDKMLVWIAPDFASDEEKMEQLCVKFKTAEIKQKFREAFNKGVAEYNTKVGEQPAPTAEKSKSKKESTVVEDVGTADPQEPKQKPSFLSKFQVQPGQWTCNTCLVQNKSDASQCAACQTPREDSSTSSTQKPLSDSSNKSSGATFGTAGGDTGSTKGPIFKTALPSAGNTGFLFGSKSGAPASGFSFAKSDPVTLVPGGAATTQGGSASTETAEKPSLFASFSGFGVKPPSADSTTPLFNTSGSLFKPPQTIGAGETVNEEAPLTSAAPTTSSLFGNTPTSSTVQSNSIFGSSTKTSSTLFGQTPSSGMFGKTDAVPSNIFGKSESTPQSIVFGKTDSTPQSSVFGKTDSGSQPSGIFGKTEPSSQSGDMVFGRRNPSQMTVDGKPMMSIFDRPQPSVGKIQDTSADGKPRTSCCPEISEALDQLMSQDLEAKAAAAEMGVVIEDGDEESSRYYCDDDGEGEYDEDYEDYEDEDYEDYYEEEGGEGEDAAEQSYLNEEDGNGLNFAAASNSPLKPALLQNVDGKDTASNRFMSPMTKFGAQSQPGSSQASFFNQPASSQSKIPPQIPFQVTPTSSAAATNDGKPPSAGSSAAKEVIDVEEDAAREPDFEVVYTRSEATDLTAEQSDAIKQYHLPPLFFDYLSKPQCPGCIGCENDDEKPPNYLIYSKESKEKEVKTAANDDVQKNKTDEESSSLDSAKTSGFLFGNKTTPEFSFASVAAGNSSGSGGAFGFGSSSVSQGKQISFTAKPLFASQLQTEGAAGNEGEGPADEKGESDEPDVHFQPIVQLSKVETKSSDEEDEVIFCQRAKLFRLVNGEWKERGIGDAKVLRYIPKNIGKFVMRREVVLKLCANHVIFEETELKSVPNLSGKGFIWVARDFAEGDVEGTVEQFLIKFKNAEIGSEFETAFNKMRQIKHE